MNWRNQPLLRMYAQLRSKVTDIIGVHPEFVPMKDYSRKQ